MEGTPTPSSGEQGSGAFHSRMRSGERIRSNDIIQASGGACGGADGG
ncbi:hypothetical protein CES86_2387 [Brucella lupini]|uniref:Uncharacterized protein n=1 Tax=Brucella lupini TaxID=255457 RepID=A0A256GRR1_9HYPH|nr:hypothetical protein CES86_2387 [Brucella lupini]